MSAAAAVARWVRGSLLAMSPLVQGSRKLPLRSGVWRGLVTLPRPLTSLRPSVRCALGGRVDHATGGVRSAHTAVDRELAEFLKDEIKLEKEGGSGGKLPQLKGFELTSTEGPTVVLTRQADNETVVIRLNVNHSMDESIGNEEEGEQDGEQYPKLVSRPAFIVEINKGVGGKTLALQCAFALPEEDLPPPSQDQQHEELIEIQDAALLEKGQEWTDEVYSLGGALMDASLYDLLLRMLEERGVSAELVHQLVEFSTTYEHQRYIGLLDQLRDFASAK